MTTKRLLLFALLFVYGLCQAQEDLPTVSADLCGNTWGTDVVPHHKVSWDIGLGFESSTGNPHIASLNTIVRYGIFENVELRVGTSVLMWNKEQASKPSFGMDPLTIGTKIKVYDGTDFLPSVGVLAALQSPHLGSKDLLPSHLAPSLYLVFENGINDWFSLCYNVGAEWDGETATPTTFLSLCLNFGITDRLGAYVESFNYLHPEDGNQYKAGLGLTWLASRRVQLYLSADTDLQNIGKHFAINGGMAWLIN